MTMINLHVKLLCVTTMLLLVLCCSKNIEVDAASNDGAPQAEIAAKVRQTRGFRNSALATARGFGKRNYHRELNPALNAAMSNSAAISTSWLAEQMSKNPEIAQLVVERFVDTDGDGLVTMDDLMRSV